MNEMKLPPLPREQLLGTETAGHVLECYGHTDETLKAYATAAIQADRAERGGELPSIPDDVLAYIHAYGDSRADDDGLSSLRIGEAIIAIRRWAGSLYATPPAHVEVLKQCVEAMELSLEDGAAYYMHVRDAIAAARQITDGGVA